MAYAVKLTIPPSFNVTAMPVITVTDAPMYLIGVMCSHVKTMAHVTSCRMDTFALVHQVTMVYIVIMKSMNASVTAQITPLFVRIMVLV